MRPVALKSLDFMSRASNFDCMKGTEKDRGGLQQSFLTGVIALVFLLVGYQTALLVHRAAVVKIAANRDEPDTVYVYMSATDSAKEITSTNDSEELPQMVVHKPSSHTLRAKAVRENVPYKSPQLFSFNPNTASVEDLCRLGFTQKQAESIDAYRRKGGRFNRKSDFAKSYVVSDSVYSRLEPYIDIPLLDINVADSASLDNLPGIGGWYAAKIIEYRKLLGGYSFKEQLMDIYRFDQDRYDKISDLIVVKSDHLVPFELWTLPADSLRKHPYIRNYSTAQSIVLYRENSPKMQWSVDDLARAGVLVKEDADRLKKCVIADP